MRKTHALKVSKQCKEHYHFHVTHVYHDGLSLFRKIWMQNVFPSRGVPAVFLHLQ